MMPDLAFPSETETKHRHAVPEAGCSPTSEPEGNLEDKDSPMHFISQLTTSSTTLRVDEVALSVMHMLAYYKLMSWIKQSILSKQRTSEPDLVEGRSGNNPFDLQIELEVRDNEKAASDYKKTKLLRPR